MRLGGSSIFCWVRVQGIDVWPARTAVVGVSVSRREMPLDLNSRSITNINVSFANQKTYLEKRIPLEHQNVISTPHAILDSQNRTSKIHWTHNQVCLCGPAVFELCWKRSSWQATPTIKSLSKNGGDNLNTHVLV
jgi:hypothetical protein